MPDFTELLRKPAGEAKEPEPLPQAEFPAIIKSHEFGDNNRNKTPYVRYHLAYTGWPEGVEPVEGIDLTKKTGRKDFYLTEDSLYRLDDFLRGLGIELEGRSYEETIPEAVGMHVIAEVVQQLNQQTNKPFNLINDVRPAE